MSERKTYTLNKIVYIIENGKPKTTLEKYVNGYNQAITTNGDFNHLNAKIINIMKVV